MKKTSGLSGLAFTYRVLIGALFVLQWGCSLLPPPITQASPKARVARAMEKKLAGVDSVFVMPTWVEYEKVTLGFPKRDSNEIRRIGADADQMLCDAIRDDLAKEPILVSDPIEQSRILGDSSILHFQLSIDGFSRSPSRRILSELKSFALMIPLFGYNLSSPINTSSDVRLYLRRGGKKNKPIYRQIDQDDLNPADPADLKWQVRKMLRPDYQGA